MSLLASATARDVFVTALLLVAVMTGRACGDDNQTRREFLVDISKQAASAESASHDAIAGTDGWLFLVSELRALGVGPFWGEVAPRVSRSSIPEYADPLPAILDFHDQLQKAGVELLMVPVPGKAAVYPEAVSGAVAAGRAAPRMDLSHREFYGILEKRGIAVLDLLPAFVEHRRDPQGPVFCQSDTHWSGRGIELAALSIFELIKDRGWLQNAPKSQLEAESRPVTITGDLARMRNENDPVRETLPVTTIGVRRAGRLVPLEPDRQSPVLLMGDSHTLVFHDPELFARGGGLPDHLARHLGFAVDLLGVRGSGAGTTRIELARRKDNLQGKRLVIWCFSFREFTETTTGWRKVPVIR